ncbi:hypothetical protein QH639_19100 [Lysinibacillus sp. 1 U-2021]|uniref:hypothetical protein n=1 Tax=Lysinibacillus sp. 1 U-2021 TaxID=3039426 RepID=UPI002480F22E|nr:hypothetical protein [Lysinibacillus sp. 1 U-2021]WGT37910.1 hypothetical protein QH639_19100 [Lysinibacillus sp. 1 U-2021]
MGDFLFIIFPFYKINLINTKAAKGISESAQKANKGLLGNVKEKVNKQVSNVKTQIQAKVDEVKQQLRQLRPSEMELAGAGVNVRRIEDTGTVGKNTSSSSPKPSNSQPPQNGSNKKPDENKGTGNANHPIRTYRNADLKKLEKKYTADPRITVEMPYVGKGKPGTNAEGWLRDKDFYWKEIMNKHPESLSKANKQKIDLGFAPINDKTFREHFPQYDMKELYNDKLIHHHVGGGGQAVAVPSKLHPGTGGIHNAEKAAGVWGNDSEYAKLLEKFLNK